MTKSKTDILITETKVLYNDSYMASDFLKEMTDFAIEHGVDLKDVTLHLSAYDGDHSYLSLSRPETGAEKEKRLARNKKAREFKQKFKQKQEEKEKKEYERLKAKYAWMDNEANFN
jgi:hypothetical protein